MDTISDIHSNFNLTIISTTDGSCKFREGTTFVIFFWPSKIFFWGLFPWGPCFFWTRNFKIICLFNVHFREEAAITELQEAMQETRVGGLAEGAHVHIVHLSDSRSSLDLIKVHYQHMFFQLMFLIFK